MTYHNNTHQVELANHGTADIWVIFADGHPVSTFRVLCPKTRTINFIHDVVYLNKSYSEWIKIGNQVIILVSYEDQMRRTIMKAFSKIIIIAMITVM